MKTPQPDEIYDILLNYGGYCIENNSTYNSAHSKATQAIEAYVAQRVQAQKIKTLETNIATLEIVASNYTAEAVEEALSKLRINLKTSLVVAKAQLTNNKGGEDE